MKSLELHQVDEDEADRERIWTNVSAVLLGKLDRIGNLLPGEKGPQSRALLDVVHTSRNSNVHASLPKVLGIIIR